MADEISPCKLPFDSDVPLGSPKTLIELQRRDPAELDIERQPNDNARHNLDETGTLYCIIFLKK